PGNRVGSHSSHLLGAARLAAGAAAAVLFRQLLRGIHRPFVRTPLRSVPGRAGGRPAAGLLAGLPACAAAAGTALGERLRALLPVHRVVRHLGRRRLLWPALPGSRAAVSVRLPGAGTLAGVGAKLARARRCPDAGAGLGPQQRAGDDLLLLLLE